MRRVVDTNSQDDYALIMETFYPPKTSVSVTELNRYLRTRMEEDAFLQNLWVSGEIYNLSRPSSGHIYFTLKDAAASLRCVIWRSAAVKIRANLRDGMAVEAHGYISVYEQGGQYQLYADAVRPAGEGYLYQEFLRLKDKLEAEGLFAAERKRPKPEYPRRIGIVTSPTGAAIQDIINTLRNRYPLAEVFLAPAAVQGEAAPLEIIAALNLLNQEIKPDIIILGRGGGSLEDLWAFNDERVVRAVAASKTPIITGIGHETDYTLCDFASDLRAPTPTGAAVLATPDIRDMSGTLNQRILNLYNSANNRLSQFLQTYQQQVFRLKKTSPLRRIQNGFQQLDEGEEKLWRAARRSLIFRKTTLDNLTARLQALNPAAVLRRGYAILSQADGTIIHSIEQIKPEDEISAQISDGKILTKVEKIIPEEREKAGYRFDDRK